jgi:hypothetical protein
MNDLHLHSTFFVNKGISFETASVSVTALPIQPSKLEGIGRKSGLGDKGEGKQELHGFR